MWQPITEHNKPLRLHEVSVMCYLGGIVMWEARGFLNAKGVWVIKLYNKKKGFDLAFAQPTHYNEEMPVVRDKMPERYFEYH